jgi:RNA polymerase sigma factor (sigma-70 family)
MTDSELLQDYVRSDSQAAFAQLVRRHTGWVYCAAVRLVRETNLAEDVVQAVFIVLARKAAVLPSSVSLNQWLFRVTRYSAIHALRDEARRRRRELRGAEWAARCRSREAESTDDWNQIVDRLDAATARLPGADRQVVLLRFYERKNMAEVGLALGVSEDAAKKRVARAVERLRGFLSAKGAVLPAATLGAVLLAHMTIAAPPALAESVVVAAVNSTRTAVGSGQAAIIAKGAIHTMMITQIRHVAAIAFMVIFPVGIVGAIMAIAVSQSAQIPSASQSATSSPRVLVAADAQIDEAPYVQAIRLVKELGHGSDARRIDANAPLNAATAAFIDRQAAIFDLVHAGAVAHSTDWGAGSGNSINMQQALDQLNGVRSLATLDVMRARQRWSEHDSLHGQGDLLDALALGRNVTHDHPILVVILVHVSIEQIVLTHWAQLLPTTPGEQIAVLPERLKQLPASPSMADMIREEQRYALNSSNAPAGVAAGMAPFYDSVAGSLDQNPTPTPEAFQKMLDDGIAKIDVSFPIIRQLAQILAPSLARAYNSVSVARATGEMFRTGISVVHEGEGAVGRSVDPFGEGPFEYAHTPQGFELRSKLQRDGKPVKLDFGM